MTKKIKCPNCGHEIEITKDDYEALLGDIKTEEIDSRVTQRVSEIKETLQAKYELEASKAQRKQEDQIKDLSAQIALLKKDKDNANTTTQLAVKEAVEELRKELAAKDQTIAQLKGDANVSNKDHELSIKQLKPRVCR